MVATMQPTTGNQAGRKFVSKQTLAVMLDVTPRTITNMMRDGRIAYVKFGGIVRIPVTEIERIESEVTRHRQSTR